MAFLGGAVAARPFAARAQRSAMPVIGYVVTRPLDSADPSRTAFGADIQGVFAEIDRLGGKDFLPEGRPPQPPMPPPRKIFDE